LADCTKLTDNTRSVHLTCKPISHLPILTSPSAASTAQSKPTFIAATIPQVGYSQPTMNFGTSPLTSTPFNKPSVQSRRVSFNPGTTSTQITNPQGARPKTQLVAVKPDISISMYAKELSRLLASGMDYDKASNAADSIVRQVMANTTNSSSRYLASNIPSKVHGSTLLIIWDENHRNMPARLTFSSSKIIFCAGLRPKLQKNEDRLFIDRSSCHYLCESLL